MSEYVKTFKANAEIKITTAMSFRRDDEKLSKNIKPIGQRLKTLKILN